MNKKKQMLWTITGILFIGLLFMGAMAFPKYFSLYNDSRILDKAEYVDINSDMYEISYTSFKDKLNAVARCTGSGNELYSVKINDAGFNDDRKSINKIIKDEFNVLYNIGVLPVKIKLYAGKISLCETYTLYSSDDKNGIKGIVYKKIIYKTKRGNIVVYIDEEYHKIYEMIIPIAAFLPKDILSANMVYDNGSNYAINEMGYKTKEDSYIIEYLYKVINGLFKYYNVYGSIIENYDTDNENYFMGIIQFEDGSILEIEKEIEGTTDSGSIRLGVDFCSRYHQSKISARTSAQ